MGTDGAVGTRQAVPAPGAPGNAVCLAVLCGEEGTGSVMTQGQRPEGIQVSQGLLTPRP